MTMDSTTTEKNASVRSRVSRVVWPWAEHQESPGTRVNATRRKALVQFAVMAVVSSLLWLKFKPVAIVAGSLAVFVLMTGLFVPRFFEAIDRVLSAFGKIVGMTLTWLLLTPFFLLVFAPGRMLLALRGKDPMQRQCPTDKKTYWTEYQNRPGLEHYRKQYR